MKRKAMLAITDFPARQYEVYSSRGLIPVQVDEGRWTEYTLDDALMLRLMLNASTSISLENASFLARKALHALYPVNPFGFTNAEELWAALVVYDWPDAPEEWDCREVVAGRWQDIPGEIEKRVTHRMPGARVQIILTLSVSKAAQDVFTAAKDLGLPEADFAAPMPEDMTHYPEWLQKAEADRRDLLRGSDE